MEENYSVMTLNRPRSLLSTS